MLSFSVSNTLLCRSTMCFTVLPTKQLHMTCSVLHTNYWWSSFIKFTRLLTIIAHKLDLYYITSPIVISLLYNGNRVSFPGGEAWPGHDTDHSPPSSVEVKNEELYFLPPPLGACMAVAGWLYILFCFRTRRITNVLRVGEPSVRVDRRWGWRGSLKRLSLHRKKH
jgi:hypothetical protein